jgi:hypothetical protein
MARYRFLSLHLFQMLAQTLIRMNQTYLDPCPVTSQDTKSSSAASDLATVDASGFISTSPPSRETRPQPTASYSPAPRTKSHNARVPSLSAPEISETSANGSTSSSSQTKASRINPQHSSRPSSPISQETNSLLSASNPMTLDASGSSRSQHLSMPSLSPFNFSVTSAHEPPSFTSQTNAYGTDSQQSSSSSSGVSLSTTFGSRTFNLSSAGSSTASNCRDPAHPQAAHFRPC